MTTTGPLTYAGHIPDEAIIAYEMLLSRLAEEWSTGPDTGPRGTPVFAPVFREDINEEGFIHVSVEHNVLRQIFHDRLSGPAEDFLIALMTAEDYRNWDDFALHNGAFAQLMLDMGHPAAEYFTSLG